MQRTARSVSPAHVPLTPLTAPPSRSGVVLLPVRHDLWRVTLRTGTVLGHIERARDAQGDRFAARRITAAGRTIELGQFWRMEDATDCFR